MKSDKHHFIRQAAGNPVARLLFISWIAGFSAIASYGQGTMTYKFEGQPSGTRSAGLGVYSEAGMQFKVLPPGGIYLSGGGIPGTPDNGTGYLEVPDGFVGSGGLTFGFTNVLPSTYFNLVSFDAAEYANQGPQTLEVVGYKPMVGTVTNFFTVGDTFQTFDLDASFTGLFKVDILNAHFSLDNVVIGGVPEPSSAALIAMGGACLVAYRRTRQRF